MPYVKSALLTRNCRVPLSAERTPFKSAQKMRTKRTEKGGSHTTQKKGPSGGFGLYQEDSQTKRSP